MDKDKKIENVEVKNEVVSVPTTEEPTQIVETWEDYDYDSGSNTKGILIGAAIAAGVMGAIVLGKKAVSKLKAEKDNPCMVKEIYVGKDGKKHTRWVEACEEEDDDDFVEDEDDNPEPEKTTKK